MNIRNHSERTFKWFSFRSLLQGIISLWNYLFVMSNSQKCGLDMYKNWSVVS